MGLTKDQAVALAATGWWKDQPVDVVAGFQLFEPRLCMDFGDFHAAVETALGRPVYSQEFGLDIEGLQREFLGERPMPTFEEVLALLPQDKLILLHVGMES